MRLGFIICGFIFLLSMLVIGHYLSPDYAFQLEGALPGEKVESTSLGWIIVIIQGVLMLLGVTFSYFYTRLSELHKKGEPQIIIGKEVRLMFSATSFYLALAASPIVFGVVILASKGASLPAQMFMAFQNGFFWQTVMPKAPVDLK